jgi:Protein of unknown function (DUF3078)
MKQFIMLSLATTVCISAMAQTTTTEAATSQVAVSTGALTKTKELKEGWTKSGTLNVNLTQSGLNSAWNKVKGGEMQTIGFKAMVDYDFDRKKGKSNWMNNIRARYGMIKLDSKGDDFTKNDDYLNFTSIYAVQMSKTISYAGLFSLESQFDKYFMSPGSIKIGPGLLYKPNANFSLMFSPAMCNITTKLATELKGFSQGIVKADETVSFGLGAFVQFKADYNIAKGINYKGFATFYSNYLNKPDVIIMDWTNLFTLTVNKYIGATVSVNMRYNDWEIGKLQVQQGLGIGFSYKL